MAEFVKIADLTYRFEQELQQSAPLRPAQLVEFALKLDPLRTLDLQEDMNANIIAGEVDASGISHILVRGQQKELIGVIDVGWAQERTKNFLNVPVKSFAETVDAILQRPGYNGKFHHEWLTLDRPPIVWCDGGHFADKNPCDLHKDS